MSFSDRGSTLHIEGEILKEHKRHPFSELHRAPLVKSHLMWEASQATCKGRGGCTRGAASLRRRTRRRTRTGAARRRIERGCLRDVCRVAQVGVLLRLEVPGFGSLGRKIRKDYNNEVIHFLFSKEVSEGSGLWSISRILSRHVICLQCVAPGIPPGPLPDRSPSALLRGVGGQVRPIFKFNIFTIGCLEANLLWDSVHVKGFCPSWIRLALVIIRQVLNLGMEIGRREARLEGDLRGESCSKASSWQRSWPHEPGHWPRGAGLKGSQACICPFAYLISLAPPCRGRILI